MGRKLAYDYLFYWENICCYLRISFTLAEINLRKKTLLHLEHVKIKWFARIHSSQFLVCKSETQLITRSETIDLIEPETGK
jgi:hypothetical protein